MESANPHLLTLTIIITILAMMGTILVVITMIQQPENAKYFFLKLVENLSKEMYLVE